MDNKYYLLTTERYMDFDDMTIKFNEVIDMDPADFILQGAKNGYHCKLLNCLEITKVQYDEFMSLNQDKK